MDVTGWMSEHGHEQVVFVADPSVGLRAVIAIHSTALGPSLGGIRFWHYEYEDDAVLDALRLSEAMSLKASMAGLHQGGGKAVVLWDDPRQPRSLELLRVIGRAIHELGGRYLAAEDVGATTADMDGIARVTPWVTGVSESAGGSGDPSAVTAFGVHRAMRAAALERWGRPSLHDRHVVVQGAGKVGAALAQLLVRDGATVAVADVDDERVRELVRTVGVDAIPAADAVSEPCAVLAPCAFRARRHARDRRRTALRDRLRRREQPARVRCDGRRARGAGDPLRTRLRRERGRDPEHRGRDRVATRSSARSASTAQIEATTARVFATARDWGVAPGRAAERLARERIASEALPGGRWEPGDPAAWTNGEALTRLRPPP